MKKSMILDTAGLHFARYWVIVYILFLKKEEDEGKLFLASTQINTVLDFILFLMKKCNPRVGFADLVLKSLFKVHSSTLDTGFNFAEFASRPYKEKILLRCLSIGFISQTEKMLAMLGRQITEKELDCLFEKNIGLSDGCKSIIALTKKLYPNKVEAFEKRKASYDRNDDMGAC